MSLFQSEKPELRFPNRSKQYRQDIDHLCGCKHPACKRHEPLKCTADYIAGYYWIGPKKFALCNECREALDAAFIDVRKAFVGQISPSERE
jgi:hypothetical protein